MAQSSDKVSILRGVGAQAASLLEAAGIDSVGTLADQTASVLFQELVKVNARKNIVKKVPFLAQLEDWIAQARQISRIVIVDKPPDADTVKGIKNSDLQEDEGIDFEFGLSDGLPGDPGKPNTP